MFKNLRKLVLGLLAVCLTGALGTGIAAGVEAYADEPATETVKAVKSVQINLNESITVKYNLTVPTGYTEAKMSFTVGESGSPITAEPQTNLTEGQNVTFELTDIGPQNMSDEITATVTFIGEEKTGVEEYTTSIKEYCKTLLKNAAAGKADKIDAQEKFEALKALVSSLLVYGDEAQTYVGKEASSTTGLTVAQKNAALKAQASSSDLAFSGNVYNGLSWSGATLWFGNKVNLVYYFKANAALQAKGALGIKIGESFIEAEIAESGEEYTEYSATYEGLSVTDFDSVIKATVAYKAEDGTVTEVGKTASYSVKSYVLRASDADKALAESAYSYGVAVKAYVEALENTTIVDYNGETVTITNTADVSSFNNYVRDVATYGFEQKYNLSYANKDGIGSSYIHTGVTDGTYIYYLTCSTGSSTTYSKNYTILKYDLTSGTVVGKSAAFSARKGSGQWNSDTYLIAYYKDGAIYVFDINDNLLSISVDDFKADGSVAPAAVENAPEFTLTNVSGMAYKDGKYATLDSNGVLRIYKESDLTTAVSSTQCATVSGGGNAKRLTASGDYLYALSLANGVITPKVTVVDWYGVKIAELTIPVTKELIGIPETIEVTKDGTTTTVTTTDFNVQNFVVIGDKAYAMMYCGVTGYSRTPFITIAPVEQQETKEVYLNYGLAERAEKGLETTAETTLAKSYSNGLGANFVYASATDGEYAYFLAGAAATAVTVTRFDVVSNAKIATSASIGGITEATVYMFVKDSFVYVYSASQNKTFCLPANFSSGTTATEVTFNFDGVSGTIKGVYYSNTRKQYAVLAGGNIYVCDEDLAAKYSFAVPSSHAVTKYDGTTATASVNSSSNSNGAVLFGEDEYIYVNYWAQGGVTPAVVAYSFDGCKLYDGIIENNVHGKANNNFKLESALVIDGDLYFTILTWSDTNGSALFKTSFSSTKEEKIVVSAGEYYEEVGSLAFADTDIKTISGNKLNGANSHGLTVDGAYGYITSTTTKLVDDLDAEGNQQLDDKGDVKKKAVLDSVYVTKFYLTTGQSVGYAKIPLSTRANVYANNDYLFIKDGYVYSVSDGKVYRGKTDIFTPDGGEMEYVENFFNITVDVATYNPEKDCFAARKGNSLYVGKYDEEADKVVLEQLSDVWTDGLLGMYADENYIYLLKEVKNNASACVSIYDWNGNAVVKNYQVSLIADSGVNNNVQSISFANGKVYFLVCCWTGVADVINGGANVVSGYLDISKIA